MSNIKFIPSQMGPVTQYSVRALSTGPLWLLIKDAAVLITALPYLPLVFYPFKTKSDKEENYHLRFAVFREYAIQALLLLVETVLLVLFFPALISLPGILFIAAYLASILIINLIAWPTLGPRIVESAIDDDTLCVSQQHRGERWIFINGICTGRSGLQQNVDRLSLLFGRKVLGIHNQSYGFISDLIECLLQRCLSYNTMDVRVATEIVKEHLVDKEVRKVVLVGHSQGGIIASMVVDYLLTELSGECMRKLEIYTFGSAASHFHNPPTNTTTLLPNTTVESPCIPYIEHYANEYDMVPRWGVLYAIKNLLTNRYAGKVFVRMGATGHMFVDHYLDPIFPLPKQGSPKASTATSNGRVNGHRDVDGEIEEANSYLDVLVDVDVGVEEGRAQKTNKPLVQTKGGRDAKQAHGHAAPVVNGNAVNGNYGSVNGVGAEGDMISLGQDRGKTAKELSRLWKYLGGASPDE
ncbi:MAG: hypothetical protein Q9225_004888 [Loekoesia sp. 1 TL-2023]